MAASVGRAVVLGSRRAPSPLFGSRPSACCVVVIDDQFGGEQEGLRPNRPIDTSPCSVDSEFARFPGLNWVNPL